MNIKLQNNNIAAPKFKAQALQPQAKSQAQASPQESVSFSKDESDVTWGDVGKGLVGAVATAAIEGVGNTISSIPQSIELAGEIGVALVKNETLGPWLKGGIGLLTAAAFVPLGVALTAVGSVGYGLFRGFSEGIENGVGGAIKAGVEDVRDFNTELAGGAREAIREFGNEKLDEGEKRFDVSPVRAGVGLAAGAFTTVQGAVQFGATTIKHIPGGFMKANYEISQSDASTPLKVAGHALSLPLAAIAAPLGIVGGAVVGLGYGVYEGYREGVGDGIKGVNELNKKYNEAAKEMIADGSDVSDS